MEIVIADYVCIQKWYDSNFLNRFTADDLELNITGYAIDNQQNYGLVDTVMIHSLQATGILKVVELTGKQNLKAYNTYEDNPNILFETIAALVYAQDKKAKFITEDVEVMDFAYKKFNMSAYSSRSIFKDWESKYQAKKISSRSQLVAI